MLKWLVAPLLARLALHGVFDDSIQITAIQWEKTIQRVAQTKMSGMQNSFEAAAGISKTT